jgi:hypothetical protein
VDAAGGFRGAVAADAAGEGELLEEALQPRQVLALVRVDLRIGSLEIGLRQNSRRAVPWTERAPAVLLTKRPASGARNTRQE